MAGDPASSGLTGAREGPWPRREANRRGRDDMERPLAEMSRAKSSRARAVHMTKAKSRPAGRRRIPQRRGAQQQADAAITRLRRGNASSPHTRACFRAGDRRLGCRAPSSRPPTVESVFGARKAASQVMRHRAPPPLRTIDCWPDIRSHRCSRPSLSNSRTRQAGHAAGAASISTSRPLAPRAARSAGVGRSPVDIKFGQHSS